jgi:hypothetical protein
MPPHPLPTLAAGRSTNRWTRSIPGLVTGATLTFVVATLGYWSFTTGLQVDELLFLRAIRMGPIEGLTVSGSSHPPLVRWVLTPLGGRSSPDWLLRLPSILASAASILIWSRILRRMIPDRVTAALLLPAMALSAPFLALGYQCLPYAALFFLTSWHGLAWFRWCERPGPSTGAVLVLSGVLCPWTHFYGLNVLIADQFIWAFLLWSRHGSRRAWATVTAITLLLALPLLPLILFYARIEAPYAIVQFADLAEYLSYFLAASAWIFSRVTWFAVESVIPHYLLWYLAFFMLLLVARPGQDGEREPAGPSDSAVLPVHPTAAAAIACGIFLAGFPAMQAHSIVSGKAMWERYAVAGCWIHWPMMAMLLLWLWGPKPARVAAAARLAIGLLVVIPTTKPYTKDYRPVVEHLRANRQPCDAFFAQDMDMWVGAGQFDRLWFERYVKLEMPLLTGPAMRRREIYKQGLPLNVADASVRRIWVYSHLFLEEGWIRDMPVQGWRIQESHTFDSNFPLVLFVREPGTG